VQKKNHHQGGAAPVKRLHFRVKMREGSERGGKIQIVQDAQGVQGYDKDTLHKKCPFDGGK